MCLEHFQRGQGKVGHLILYFSRDDGSHERFNLRRVLTHVCRLPIAAVAVHEEVVARPHLRVHVVGADGPWLVIRHHHRIVIAARGQYHGAAYDYDGSKYHQMLHALFLIHHAQQELMQVFSQLLFKILHIHYSILCYHLVTLS